MMTDRSRRIFRCPIDDPASLKASIRQSGRSVKAQALNLSHAGMMLTFVEPGQALPVGSRVDIALQTPAGPTHIAGVIRHSTKRRCGVEFVAEGNEVAEFEPPLGLQQSLFSAQKIYIEKRRQRMH